MLHHTPQARESNRSLRNLLPIRNSVSGPVRSGRAIADVRGRIALLAAIVGAAFLYLCLRPPIPQDPTYHSFADRRGWIGIPNFLDVASNLLFLLVGIGALRSIRTPEDRWPLLVLGIGLILTAAGSAWYHWAPDSHRIFWDRLPIAIVGASAFALLASQRLPLRAGRLLLVGLCLACAAGAVHSRSGDLRFYLLAVTAPLVGVMLLLPARRGTAFWVAGLILYGLARAAEVMDGPIFETMEMVSGHTLKHVLAAAATWSVVRSCR